MARYININGVRREMTAEEEEAYLASIYPVDRLTVHLKEVEAAVDKMVSAKLLELKYTNFQGEPSVGDVSAGVTDTEAEWHTEAIQVNKWYGRVYAAMYAYLDEVTEQTALSTEDFIATLPTLNL